MGDPKQLGPFHAMGDEAAEQLGLGVSLFERLADAGVEPFLLDTQAR